MLFTGAGSVGVKYVWVHALVRHVMSWPGGDQDVGFRRNTNHLFFVVFSFGQNSRPLGGLFVK